MAYVSPFFLSHPQLYSMVSLYLKGNYAWNFKYNKLFTEAVNIREYDGFLRDGIKNFK